MEGVGKGLCGEEGERDGGIEGRRTGNNIVDDAHRAAEAKCGWV